MVSTTGCCCTSLVISCIMNELLAVPLFLLSFVLLLLVLALVGLK